MEKPLLFRKAVELKAVVDQYPHQEIIIAVDAPRTVPDHTKENYSYRSCERELKKFDQYAGAFAGVASLFIRWYEIEQKYFQDIKVVETYPRIIWKKLKLPGKPKEFDKHREEVWEIVGNLVKGDCSGYNHHQIDAVMCAYTAYCYDKGQIDWFGKSGEGLIIVPTGGTPQSLTEADEQVSEKYRCFSVV